MRAPPARPSETTSSGRSETATSSCWPWHGGPPVRSERTLALQAEVWRLIDAILRRGLDDGSIPGDLSAADVILFGAMLAQPLPNASDWDRVARRQAQVYLAGMGQVDRDRLS